MIARTASRLFLAPSLALAVLVGACAPATRSIDALGTGLPPTYAVEREAGAGTITLPGAGSAALGRRVAIVIGNSSYAHVPSLDNPLNDANAMATLLRQNGFQVIMGMDLGRRAFEGLLRNAVRAGGPGAEIVAFYAGHGFQVAARNYLVPVDARLEGANDLPFNTIRLDTILKILGDRSDRHISFLDSCRNNPFPGREVKTGAGRGTGSTALGFSEPTVPAGGLVGYATRPGAVAYDGEGTTNSPFTAALVANIRADPAASLLTVLPRVRTSVRTATAGRQIPTWTSRISGRFAIAPPTAPVAAISPGAAAVGVAVAERPPPQVRPTASPDAASPAPLPDVRPTVTVEAPMEKIVAAGGRIAEKLALPPEAAVTVVRPPGKGTLAAVTASATLAAPPPKSLEAANAGAIVYVAPPDQKPTTGSAAGDAATDTLTVEVTLPAAPPQRVEVTLRLTPNECDVEAGEFLDLQGVGIFRPDGALAAGRAIRACAQAVRDEPGNGRFRFQLGKALEKAGKLAEAVGAYKKAAALGHLRADNALGRIAVGQPGQEPAGMAYFRRCAAKGDPVCAQSLGILLLRIARSPADREEAYEHLAYAMDFGLPGAMRALARHFGDPASPDHDPERARVFEREAQSREADLGLRRSTVGPSETTRQGGALPDPGEQGGPGDPGGAGRN